MADVTRAARRAGWTGNPASPNASGSTGWPLRSRAAIASLAASVGDTGSARITGGTPPFTARGKGLRNRQRYRYRLQPLEVMQQSPHVAPHMTTHINHADATQVCRSRRRCLLLVGAWLVRDRVRGRPPRTGPLVVAQSQLSQPADSQAADDGPAWVVDLACDLAARP